MDIKEALNTLLQSIVGGMDKTVKGKGKDAQLGDNASAVQVPNLMGMRRAYNDYAINAASNGEDPMPFEYWASQQR